MTATNTAPRRSYKTAIISAIVIVGALIGQYASDGMQQARQSFTPAKAAVATPVDQAMQAKRDLFIDKMINAGIFQKVEKLASLPHAYVTPVFYALNFDDKQRFVAVIDAQYKAIDPSSFVVLYDSRSGKKVGTFNGRLSLN
jgi:hypothetical protein